MWGSRCGVNVGGVKVGGMVGGMVVSTVGGNVVSVVGGHFCFGFSGGGWGGALGGGLGGGPLRFWVVWVKCLSEFPGGWSSCLWWLRIARVMVGGHCWCHGGGSLWVGMGWALVVSWWVGIVGVIVGGLCGCGHCVMVVAHD